MMEHKTLNYKPGDRLITIQTKNQKFLDMGM